MNQLTFLPQPPASNTGVLDTSLPTTDNFQTCSLGWLTFTLDPTKYPELVDLYSTTELIQAFLDYWCNLAGDKLIERRFPGLHGYQFSKRSLSGLIFSYSEDRSDASCQVRQSALETLSLSQQKDLLVVLSETFRAKFTRLDLTVDDSTGNLTKERVYQAYKDKAIRSRSQVREWVENRRKGAEGWTLYIGSRMSESFLRVYDKTAEQLQKGKIVPEGIIRLESELKGAQAQTQAQRLIESDIEGWIKIFLQQIRSQVDFIEHNDSNKSRCRLAEWWAEITKGEISFRLPIPRALASIDKVLSWFHFGVGSTLSFLSKYFGEEQLSSIVDSLIQEYSNRLNSKQLYLLQNLQIA